MAIKYSIEESTLVSIANEIRNMRNITSNITPENMASLIQSEADSNKISVDTCAVSLYEEDELTTKYLNGTIVYYTDSQFSYCSYTIPSTNTNAPLVLNVPKGTLIFVSTGKSCGYSDIVGNNTTVCRISSYYTLFVINGDTDIRFMVK